MLIASLTGSTSYSLQITNPVARLMLTGTYVTNVSELNNTRFTLTKSGSNGAVTVWPELTFTELCDICGAIDALIYLDATAKKVFISFPISLGGTFFEDQNDFNLSISSAIAGNTWVINALEDNNIESDFVIVKKIGCLADSEKLHSTGLGVLMFVNPAQVTRVKLVYPNRTVELTADEIRELSRVNNPVHQVTLAGALTAGFGTLAMLNIKGTMQVSLTMSANSTPIIVEHIL